MRSSVVLETPADTSFSGGMRRPSAKISVLSDALEPGTRPPTSVW